MRRHKQSMETFQQYFNNKYYSHMTDDTVNWKLSQRTCANLNSVDTDLCDDGETTGTRCLKWLILNTN